MRTLYTFRKVFDILTAVVTLWHAQCGVTVEDIRFANPWIQRKQLFLKVDQLIWRFFSIPSLIRGRCFRICQSLPLLVVRLGIERGFSKCEFDSQLRWNNSTLPPCACHCLPVEIIPRCHLVLARWNCNSGGNLSSFAKSANIQQATPRPGSGQYVSSHLKHVSNLMTHH